MDMRFFEGKRVLVTGHTGFKGSWLCRILVGTGAQVTGFSLPAPTQPSLFALAGLEGKMNSMIGDVRDYPAMRAAFERAQPEIVLHLAAQPIAVSYTHLDVYKRQEKNMEKMIEVNDVSMRFRMANDRIRSIKEYAVQRMRGRLTYTDFEALSHVSFDVRRGEVVGLIGRNGAGKSTLLKVISGILKPTEGSVTVRGNIAPMLELGSGCLLYTSRCV